MLLNEKKSLAIIIRKPFRLKSLFFLQMGLGSFLRVGLGEWAR